MMGLKWLFGLGLLLASLPGWGLERLGMPAYVEGSAPVSIDFNFTQAEKGNTRVDMALGGWFRDLKLPAQARRAPRLQVSAHFVNQGNGQEEAKGGFMDLNQTLVDYGKNLAQALSPTSKMNYWGYLFAELMPQEYVVVLQLTDPELGIQEEKRLHLTVPSLADKTWAVGDLKFCQAVEHSQDKTFKEEYPKLDLNPWRELGKGKKLPLLVEYDLRNLPRDWAGQSLVHRYVISKLNSDKKSVWEHEEIRPCGVGQSFEIFRMPDKLLKGFESGFYLLLVEVWPQRHEQEKRYSYKSFAVLN